MDDFFKQIEVSERRVAWKVGYNASRGMTAVSRCAVSYYNPRKR